MDPRIDYGPTMTYYGPTIKPIDPLWTHYVYGPIIDSLSMVPLYIWTHCEPTMDPLRIHYGSTMDPLWTLYGPTMDPLWTHYGPTMDLLWTHYGPTMDPHTHM